MVNLNTRAGLYGKPQLGLVFIKFMVNLNTRAGLYGKPQLGLVFMEDLS